MAKEKFINGKKDEAHHDGRYSNTKREQEADYHLLAYLLGEFEEEGLERSEELKQTEKNQ